MYQTNSSSACLQFEVETSVAEQQQHEGGESCSPNFFLFFFADQKQKGEKEKRCISDLNGSHHCPLQDLLLCHVYLEMKMLGNSLNSSGPSTQPRGTPVVNVVKL